MTATGLQKKLVFVILTASSLLGIYILSVNLEIPWWVVVHGFTQGPSRSAVSEAAGGLVSEHWTQTPPGLIFQPELHRRAHTPTSLTYTEKQLVQNNTLLPPTQGPKSTSGGEGNVRTTVGAPVLQAERATEVATITERPFIGDSYTSEDLPPQTDCSNSIRGRISQTDFSRLFLRSVPVLQWAKHATPDQYKRLSRYPGAHGWGGIDYKTLTEALSVLNSSANWQMLDDWTRRSTGSECIRCAVVGNGGILKNSTKGREIDAHDYVFRTNGAIIKGFEQDVGSRTTHYTFSTNTLMNSMRGYAGLGFKGPPVSEETRYIFLPDHDRDYLLMEAAATHTAVQRGPERNIYPTSYFGKDVSAEKLKIYHPDFIRYLRNRFLRSNAMKTKYQDMYRPSTGAVMLLAALHSCDQVSAYGFMTPDYSKYSDHYYDSKFHPVGFFINHDLRLEMSLWRRLHSAGLIRLYMRQKS
ncbi:alpha-N-acetylgalactosaminide alpha-2,6-sialyltransferase 2 isoform X2 [Genypterus blacodes]|uniref:alpha-N-acetylgalactosaminide alpha-2,6-sialyltransferase 2 isoform X2 n=1 Tax=Genypterus blacodes TaxID=154954 RepID=UPI003F76AFD4